MAKSGKKSTIRRSFTSKKHRRAAPRPFHIVPDALAALAPVDVMMEADTVNLVKQGEYGTAMNYLVTALTTPAFLKAPAILLVGSYAAKYIGKVTGLNRVGGKKFKLF